MTIQEFYASIGEDYAEVIRRLGNEALIKKVLKMLTRDKTMDSLAEALKQKDYVTAFRCAHTLKGIVMNLGLSQLSESASQLTETLRSGQYDPAIEPEFEQLQVTYTQVTVAINAFFTSAETEKEG